MRSLFLEVFAMSLTPFLAAEGPADLVLRGGHVFVARGRPRASALAERER